MTVRQVIELARVSELNGLSTASKDDVVLGFLNMGVLELYKRFTLKVEEYLVTLEDNVSIYKMPDDFMWLVSAYGEVDVRSPMSVNVLPVNEEDNPLSINTVSWNKIQVPVSSYGSYISLIYVASPTMYTVADLDETIDLPVQMLDPLLAYMGYRAYSAVDTGVQTEDSVWYIRFENSCTRVRTEGMINSNDMFTNGRIDTRGFV